MNGLYSILKPPGSHTPGGFFITYRKNYPILMLGKSNMFF